MRLLNVVVSAGLLLSLASCGENDKGHVAKRSVDPLVTSADWKIVLEGRSFPDKALVTVNDDIVVNECADKQSYFIDRESTPQVLPMDNFAVPTEGSVKIEITDLGANCADDSDDSTFHSGPETKYEMTKDGAHAEIVIRL
jgi:hypothetical protein